MDVISECAENSWGTHKRVVVAVQRVWGSPRLIINAAKPGKLRTKRLCNEILCFTLKKCSTLLYSLSLVLS